MSNPSDKPDIEKAAKELAGALPHFLEAVKGLTAIARTSVAVNVGNALGGSILGKIGFGTAARVAMNAAGPAMGGGAGAAGGTGGVAGAVSSATGLSVPLIGLGFAALTATMALKDMVVNARENSKALIDSQKHLGQFNAQFAMAQMKLEIGQVRRDIVAANATSESFSNLAESHNRLADSMAPADNAWANLKNNFQSAINNGVASINETIGPVMEGMYKTLNEMLFEMKRSQDKNDKPLTDTEFLRDVFRANSDARNAGKFGPPIPNTGAPTNEQFGR